MPVRPSRCSIAAETARRFDRQKLGKIEFHNRPQGLRRGAVLLIVRQRIQPAAILHLEFGERGDRIVPALDPAAPIDRTAYTDNWCAIGMRGAVTRLTFGSGHGCFTDSWMGHGSTPVGCVTRHRRSGATAKRYVTLEPRVARARRAIGQGGGGIKGITPPPPRLDAGMPHRLSSWPISCGRFCWPAPRRRVCAACVAVASPASPWPACGPAEQRTGSRRPLRSPAAG